MAATQHYFPKFELQMGNKDINFSSDTLMWGLIASGTYTWGTTPEGQTFVGDFLGGDGTHGALTEVTGGNYTRISATSVSFTSSGEVITLTTASPVWNNVTFSCVYAFLYDSSVGANDAAHPIIAYWDFGGTQSPSAQPFQLTVSGSGLVAWTAS